MSRLKRSKAVLLPNYTAHQPRSRASGLRTVRRANISAVREI